MPTLDQLFPSTYLKAADLNGNSKVMQIERVSVDSVGGEEKPVISFLNASKRLVMNKTNARTIASVTGSENTDSWTGAVIRLFVTPVDVRGEMKMAIRVHPEHPSPEEVDESPF